MGREFLNDWKEKFEYSLAQQQEFDMQMLRRHIPKCESIRKTDAAMDKRGVDYIATLDDGAEVLIDAKTRTPGSSRWWKNGEPDLALEIWSVCEAKKIGWTLSSKSDVDYILYTFDKSDWGKYYFIPFQLLRKAFYDNGRRWVDDYGRKKQRSNSWTSEAVFVPVSVVLGAIHATMMGNVFNN